MQKSLIILLAVGSLLIANSKMKAEEIAVTEVKMTPEVVLNGFLKIRGMDVITKEKELKLPEAKAHRSGQVWPQVKIIDKNLEKAIINAIKTGKVSGALKGKPSYKIDDLIIVTKDNSYWEGPGELKAVAWITFDNAISVKCKFIETQREPMRFIIGWPTQPIEGHGFMPIVTIMDNQLKKDIEKEFIRKYRSQVGKEKP